MNEQAEQVQVDRPEREVEHRTDVERCHGLRGRAAAAGARPVSVSGGGTVRVVPGLLM
jgi:hypothetical protein